MIAGLDRRQLLAIGGFGLGTIGLGLGPAVAAVMTVRGFTHGVASGEPGGDSVLLWTRHVGDGADSTLIAEIAHDAGFRRILGSAKVRTGAWRDWTAKATIAGLQPGTTYHYRFIAADGSVSPTGRTRTLPADDARRVTFAVFSCANLPFGHFNAYGHAAARTDLDFALHLGDYYYEYRRGFYPDPKDVLPGRVLEPAGEAIALADYRLRHACYRADPDLQALHAALPMIASWDDHETANDSWEGGAQNHDASEGDWSVRKAAAIQAWREWLPVSELPWATYDLGRLGTLYRTDTRLAARSRPPSPPTGDARALAAFRDGAWMDPAATMMGTEQEAWLAARMRGSIAAGRRWQLLGSGAIVANLLMPANADGWLDADAPAFYRGSMAAGVALGAAGMPFNMDAWGGYPQARARLLGMAQALEADLIVLSGDSHNSWAFDLAQQGKPAGVEFAGHSVSSSGYETVTRTIGPATVARGFAGASPELRWADLAHRGYMAVDLTADRASCTWINMRTIADRSQATVPGKTLWVSPGRRRLEGV
ncbi:alkaline phosphatase D [Sphingomonas zeicaulis]|uniref:alkaline phosphatase D family protein n=1 Tax=Sphingomonas zeicaulis TaxID=1632740 RepID=UPI003D1C546E